MPNKEAEIFKNCKFLLKLISYWF